MTVIGLVGCATSTPLSSPASPGPGRQVVGSFNVGDHSLYLDCEGDPAKGTVVYIHGFIETPAGGGRTNGAGLQSRMAPHYRFCIYDRANVGRSGKVAGPLSSGGAAKDLHVLLAAAHIKSPYVLLGASFGGLVAVTYAGTYPSDVSGMVLLDPTLPYELDTDAAYVPEKYHLHPDDWKSTTEQMDYLQSFADAKAVEPMLPTVPATLLATSTLELPPETPAQPWSDAIRADQLSYMARFAPGAVKLVDSPRYMEPAIPDRIVAETTAILDKVK